MTIKVSTETCAKIHNAQDLGDFFAYCERWGDNIAYTFPESEQERIETLMLNINYKQGEYKRIWEN